MDSLKAAHSNSGEKSGHMFPTVVMERENVLITLEVVASQPIGEFPDVLVQLNR